jgi:hypothetical protein
MTRRVLLAIAATAYATLAHGVETTVTVNTSTQGKKTPVEGALVVVYDAGRNSVVAQATTGADGKVQLDVNPKPKYDLVAFCKGHKLLIKKDVRLSQPLEVTMIVQPKGQLIAIVDGSGLSLFDGNEKDIQVGTTYGGHTSCDFRCMNDQTLIGFDKPTLTTIQRCSPGQSFVVKKGKRRAKCDVLWSLPSGFVVQYRVSH